MLKVAIVSGGYSSEYNVSIQSGLTVYKNLNTSKYDPYLIIINPDNWVLKRDNGDEIALNREDFSVVVNGEHLKFDYVFIAIHGDPGENGVFQEYLDQLNIPYSTCGVSTSQLTFDKDACKAYFSDTEVKLAKSMMVKKGEKFDADAILNIVGLPCFVKPNNGGSSCGISKVKAASELHAALELGFSEDDEVMVEEFIDGREITCGVYKADRKPIALAITEIVTENEFFDYEAKYTAGKSDEITPADIPSTLAAECERLSIFMYEHLNCRGLCRFDFIVQNDELYYLEVNTVPGLSPASIIPKQAEASGIELGDLFSMVIEETCA
ncbi:MAG: D-alanine--D-alanine ligase [Flavobacteriales bacterium]|nr:D-alanine--D-alanine ligase [Flavobacteriales bacterium]